MTAIYEPFGVIGLLILLGALIRQRGLIDGDTTARLSTMVVDVTLPALFFLSMYTNVTWELLRTAFWFPIIAFFVCWALRLISLATSGLFTSTDLARRTYAVLCSNGNTVFLPVPIVLALFGVEGLIYVFMFELGAGLYYWSFGVSLFQEEATSGLNPKALSLNFFAMILGAVFGIYQIPIGGVLLNSLQYLSDIVVGLAMLITGSLIYALAKQGVFWRKEILGVIIHRTIVSPVIGLMLLTLFRFNHTAAIVLMIQLSMPPLLTTALVAARYGADDQLAALGVIIPTIGSLVTVPLTLFLVNMFF